MKILLALVNAVVFLAEVVKRWQKAKEEEKLAKAMEKVLREESVTELNHTLHDK